MHSATGLFIVFFVALLAAGPAVAQRRAARPQVVLELVQPVKHTFGWRRFLPGLRPDADRNFRPLTTHLAPPVNTTALLGDFFWMGSVTRQSYNQGKIGRDYYWDVQGNLRGSCLFVDIAGKGKRGLKLAFPRHRALF